MAPSSPGLPAELAQLLPSHLHALCVSGPVARGTCLFETGRLPVAMFFVSTGEVVLERLGEDGEMVVLQRTRHGLIGEASLQVPRYHCDARVTVDAQITHLPRLPLLHALTVDTAFAVRWIAMLNREVRRLRQQCERLSLNTVQARLLHLLRTEGGPEGVSLGAGLKSLAPELGVTHEALYRCVAQLERQGQLRRQAGRLWVETAAPHITCKARSNSRAPATLVAQGTS